VERCERKVVSERLTVEVKSNHCVAFPHNTTNILVLITYHSYNRDFLLLLSFERLGAKTPFRKAFVTFNLWDKMYT